jgi:predicted kinase
LRAALENLYAADAVNARLLCGRLLERRPIKALAEETGLTIHAVHCRLNRLVTKLRCRLSGRRSDGKGWP